MINIYLQKLTPLQQIIVRLLFTRAGTALNQRQVAKLLGVSPPAVMKALPSLEKEGFIKLQQDKETKRWSIELNRDHHRILQLKRVDNLKLLYETGLADLLEKEFAGATIVVFGSYSRGEDIGTSDVDIAIIGRKEKTIDLTRQENQLERKISLQFYGSWKKIHKHLKENLCNGIVLVGGVTL